MLSALAPFVDGALVWWSSVDRTTTYLGGSVEHSRATMMALQRTFGSNPDRADPGQLYIAPTITLLADRLEEVDLVLDAMAGRKGRRAPTEWMQEIVGKSLGNGWGKNAAGEVTFRGRTCCADTLIVVERGLTKGLVRPPVEFTCNDCDTLFALEMKAIG